MKSNIATRLKNVFKPTASTDNLPIDSLGSVSIPWLRTLKHYDHNSYENGYSSIRAIANRFMVLKPHAIDENGAPLKTAPNVINTLSRPNQQMSGVDFRDALAVMTMVHDCVYLLVHEKAGKTTRPATEGITEQRVAGFTFLEGVTPEIFDGKMQYRVMVGNEQHIYYDHQVMTIHDVDPGHLAGGYSPSKAARRWTKIDDFIADYQSGFFENGAVPAGQFVITAPSRKEFDDIVDGMQTKNRGAGKNNNVTYTYQPVDKLTGKPSQATVTWVPFNNKNKDLALGDIFEQANSKIDSVYGVSAFIRAIDEAPNFATAQVIERNFVENTVRPFAIKKWARFQHELNRITGGIGYGISFELDTPHIAEELQKLASTNQVSWATLKDIRDSGYTLDSAIKALQLPPHWALLKEGESDTTTIDNEKTDVDEGQEVEGSPEAVITHRQTTRPKNISKEDETNYEQQIREPARVLMERQVERAVADLDPQDTEATDEDKDKFIDDTMLVVSTILLYGGTEQWEEGRQLLLAAGLEAPTKAYSLSSEAKDRYREYLEDVADSYTDDTAKSIRSVLQRSADDDWSKGKIEKELRAIMNTDEWRVKRLATTEVNRSGSLSSVESMISIQDETDAEVESTIQHLGADAPCEFCASLIGVWSPVEQPMIEKGQTVVGTDGGVLVNNFVDNLGSDPHPNGHCVPEFRVVA